MAKPLSRGFTLLETLIAITIFVVATVMVGSYISTSYEAGRFGQEQNEAIESARRGIETMVEEIREGGPSSQGGYMILANQSQSLKFYSDVDKDGALEQIHYWLDGSDFKKEVIEPNQAGEYPAGSETVTILSRYVRNSNEAVFTYYNADYPVNMANNPLSYQAVSIGYIRLVDIYLRIDFNPLKSPNNYILRSKVQIRTLKDNL